MNNINKYQQRQHQTALMMSTAGVRSCALNAVSVALCAAGVPTDGIIAASDVGCCEHTPLVGGQFTHSLLID